MKTKMREKEESERKVTIPTDSPDREGIRKNLIQRMVGESVGEFGRGPETSARINA